MLADALIELRGANGNIVRVADERSISIANDVFSQAPADATDTAIAPLNQGARNVLAALENSQDPLQWLDVAAAGLTGGSGDDGAAHLSVSHVLLKRSRRCRSERSCNDPLKTCTDHNSHKQHVMSMTMEDDIKRWTAKRKAALVMEIIQGKSRVAEASRAFDLALSEIETWVDEAKRGMENALRAKPMDIREQYEKQLKEFQEAYGEAMLELRARKKLQSLLGEDDK